MNFSTASSSHWIARSALHTRSFTQPIGLLVRILRISILPLVLIFVTLDVLVLIYALELKRAPAAPEGARRTIMAFANTAGGALLAGEIGMGPHDPRRPYYRAV